MRAAAGLRASGLPYTGLRSGWFDAGTGTEERVDPRQGDLVEYGLVRRESVAETSSSQSAPQPPPLAPSRSSP